MPVAGGMEPGHRSRLVTPPGATVCPLAWSASKAGMKRLAKPVFQRRFVGDRLPLGSYPCDGWLSAQLNPTDFLVGGQRDVMQDAGVQVLICCVIQTPRLFRRPRRCFWRRRRRRQRSLQTGWRGFRLLGCQLGRPVLRLQRLDGGPHSPPGTTLWVRAGHRRIGADACAGPQVTGPGPPPRQHGQVGYLLESLDLGQLRSQSVCLQPGDDPPDPGGSECAILAIGHG